MLDAIASRYHLLPSQVLKEADTLDFTVMDVTLSYERYQTEREEAKSNGAAPPIPNIPVNTLQQMIERVRGQ